MRNLRQPLESPKTMISMMWRWMLSLAVWSWKPTHISPDCPLISDEEREAIAKRREAAFADRSCVVRFRPIPAWLARDQQQPLIRQGEKPHLRFGERHNVGMDKKTSYGVSVTSQQ
jgi:hypothetical protein